MEDRDRLALPALRSDLEEEAFTEQERHNVAQQILESIGNMLEYADKTLGDIEDEGRMGSAIVRTSQALADSVGSIADHLDQQTDEEYQALARASLQDAHEALLLHEEGQQQTSSSLSAAAEQPSSELQDFANMSEDDMVKAIRAASGLLRDVEETLRAVDQDEADELADVALTVAHLFVASLQSVHSTVSPDDLLLQTSSTKERSSVQIEMISAEDEGSPNNERTAAKSGKEQKQKKNQRNFDRLRVLWPPVGPAVGSAFDWGKEEASKKPLLAVALGITLWPAAVMTAVFGAPLVVADGVVQNIYNNFQDTPVIHGIERSAAQLFHTGRLTLMCGKLLGKQSIRVVSRQVERHGGVGKIAQNAGGMAIDRITHPIQTVGMCWNTVAWGAGALRDVFDNLNDQERDETVQDLQQ